MGVSVMLNRSTIFAAALVIFAVATVPARANSVHGEKGASGQGLASDAHFKPSTMVNGITVTPFVNSNAIAPFDALDIFQIPSAFTTGTNYTLTFASLANVGGNPVYGIFDCDNGSNPFAISEDMPPVNLGSTCTKGPLGSNDKFVSFSESGNKSTISFLGGTGAPSIFYFWTTDGNLTGIAPATTSTTPEPSTFVLFGSVLIGLALFGRRLAHS
jgi:hypothetical protein